MRILLTGFPPFPGREINPTQQLVRAIQSSGVSVPPDIDLRADVVPCSYRGVESVFTELVESHRPDVVLAFGVGHSGSLLHLERQAYNLDDATVPDNDGELRSGAAISSDGPPILNSTVDVDRLCADLQQSRVDAIVSLDAGRYLCNHLLYYGLQLAAQQASVAFSYRMAFVHVRPLNDTISEPTEFSELTRAVEVMLQSIATCEGTLD